MAQVYFLFAVTYEKPTGSPLKIISKHSHYISVSVAGEDNHFIPDRLFGIGVLDVVNHLFNSV